jgi:hypothetical protein
MLSMWYGWRLLELLAAYTTQTSWASKFYLYITGEMKFRTQIPQNTFVFKNLTFSRNLFIVFYLNLRKSTSPRYCMHVWLVMLGKWTHMQPSYWYLSPGIVRLKLQLKCWKGISHPSINQILSELIQAKDDTFRIASPVDGILLSVIIRRRIK